MRKIVFNIVIVMLLIACSMLFVSCEAITAQNININSNSGMNGFPGIGAPGMNGGPGQRMNHKPEINGNQGMSKNMNSDLMGKIISVDGNLITIELIKQTKNNTSSNSNDEKQDVKDNQNNDNNNNKSQKGFSDNKLEANYTGTYKALEVSTDADISQELSMSSQNDNSQSSLNLSNLKKDQIIMIWYKEGSETVGKIRVVQS